MKIIHCSDLHLDSPLGRNFTPAQAKTRNAELCATFGRMVQFARREQVEAVLLAGDLFDSGYASARTVEFVLDQIRNAPQVTFFYIRGNHDGGRDPFDGAVLPRNLKTFGPVWTSYPCGDALITGMELGAGNGETSFSGLSLPADRCNIVMLHGDISGQPGPDHIPVQALRGKHIDYLALGHLHSYQAGKLDDRGIFCYSGCLEGRGFDECGEKGFVLLHVQPGGIRREFLPFAERTLHEIPVDITDAETAPRILARLRQSAESIPSKDLVKFVLTGTCTVQTQKDTAFMEKMLAPEFFYVKIKDESRLQVDWESYEMDASLRGEFVRLVMASGKSEEDKQRIVSCGLGALGGEEAVL